MDARDRLVELLEPHMSGLACEYESGSCELTSCRSCNAKNIADHLIANGVTVQECAYWQYIEDDIDEDNNIQAYCSVCGAGDKHATSMIGKVPYCWKCGRKMIPQPPKGE